MCRSNDCSDQGSDSSLGELVGDDDALQLARPLPDPLDPQLTPEPLGDVLAHVAAAAEDLDTTVSDASGHLGGVQLGHGALRMLHLAISARIDPACGLVDEG